MRSIKEVINDDFLFPEEETTRLNEFEFLISEPQIQEPIVSRLAQDFGKIAFQASQKRWENSISQKVKEEITRTALYLYQCKGKQSHKKLQILQEIEEAYHRSNSLMAFLKKAAAEDEISHENYLHFEIQIKVEMQKMLMAIGKIMVGV